MGSPRRRPATTNPYAVIPAMGRDWAFYLAVTFCILGLAMAARALT